MVQFIHGDGRFLMTTKIQELQNALDQLARSLNTLGGANGKTATTAEWFEHLHRTQQQEVMRSIVMPILRTLDEQYTDGFYDLRSEASVKLAHNMLAAVATQSTYLPLV